MKNTCSLHKFTDRFGFYAAECTCGLPYSKFIKGYNSVDEIALVTFINKYRDTCFKPPLEINPILMLVARDRVKHFDHHANGQWVWQAATQAGYSGFCTDNLAQGYESPEDAVGTTTSGWGDQRAGHNVGHADQMLGYFKINGEFKDYNFTELGVASYPTRKQYIAIFGTPKAPDYYTNRYGGQHMELPPLESN